MLEQTSLYDMSKSKGKHVIAVSVHRPRQKQKPAVIKSECQERITVGRAKMIISIKVASSLLNVPHSEPFETKFCSHCTVK